MVEPLPGTGQRRHGARAGCASAACWLNGRPAGPAHAGDYTSPPHLCALLDRTAGQQLVALSKPVICFACRLQTRSHQPRISNQVGWSAMAQAKTQHPALTITFPACTNTFDPPDSSRVPSRSGVGRTAAKESAKPFHKVHFVASSPCRHHAATLVQSVGEREMAPAKRGGSAAAAEPPGTTKRRRVTAAEDTVRPA